MSAAPSDHSPRAQEPLRALLGTTASGKTELALALADLTGAEILSLDSMQVYRGMDVGTAKPTTAQRALIRHHLLDLVDPSERYDASRYLADSRTAERELASRGARAFHAGGTPLYLKLLVHGLFDGPPPDLALRSALLERARLEGADSLHSHLRTLDPSTAARLHPNDIKRVARALEVLAQTGQPLSTWQAQWHAPGGQPPGRNRRLLGLWVDPSDLDARITSRTRAMLAAGWPEESLSIERSGGFGPTAIHALGYSTALALARGEIDLSAAQSQIARDTRQFARRQRTWFRKFPEILWLTAPRTDPERKRAAEAARAFFEW